MSSPFLTDRILSLPESAYRATASHAAISMQVIAGRQKILARHGVLMELSERYGQTGAMDHLEYFLSSEESLRKTPYLVLLGIGMDAPGASTAGVLGALLINEYRVLGCGTRIFATDDTTGRRTLIAPEDRRAMFSRLAVEALMRSRAEIVLLSVLETAGRPVDERSKNFAACETFQGKESAWMVATRRRMVPSYLALGSTMDETLAKMGQKTRSNLRYYRRRAEAQLGCSFVADVQIGKAEFQAFNRECAYGVTDERAAWRHAAVTRESGVFFCGFRDGDGRWLSMLGGRRYGDMVEIDWQMNRSDLPAYSLSTVMRSYFMEFEISRGTRRMYIEGGTPHAMRFSFEKEIVRDTVLLRRPMLARLLLRAANRLLPSKNFLLEILMENQLQWKRWMLQ